jgi:hypothetical protein
MRKAFLVLVVIVLAAPVASAVAAGEGPNPSQACRGERTAIGAKAFGDLYGTNADKSNAFGKCVVKKTHVRATNHMNAVSACTAEQGDADFATTHGGKTFAQFYGTGNGKNAFGKCVAAKATASNQASDDAETAAAKQCKTERASGAAAFKAKYGTNSTKSNAFGKCVAQKAKTNAS